MSATIAVIDDDAPFIRFIERALTTLGYECQPITTFDIVDTVRIIEEGRFEAAIVDLYMYDRASGFACIDAIRQSTSAATLPLIIASGAHGKLAGQAPFLVDTGVVTLAKPFGLDELTRALQLARAVAPTPLITEVPPAALTLSVGGQVTTV